MTKLVRSIQVLFKAESPFVFNLNTSSLALLPPKEGYYLSRESFPDHQLLSGTPGVCLGEKVAWIAGTALKCHSCVSVLTKLEMMMFGSPLFKANLSQQALAEGRGCWPERLF